MSHIVGVQHSQHVLVKPTPQLSFSNFISTTIPMLTGASDVTISSNAHLYETHGDTVIDHVADTDKLKKIQSLPRAQASQKDYETRQSGPCFPGTRKALLQETMDWVTNSGRPRMYVLSGLAGIGKSTVAYTLATRVDELGLLGASFFFSRDDADRNNAKKFFSTIAYQLCVHNEAFADAIGDVLLKDRGSAVATQNSQEQLKNLILDPLRSIVQSCAQPILVIVDALDECDEDDERAVFEGLCRLVRELPSFKVILTTRSPQPLAGYLLSDYGHNIFHLEDIEDKVIDDDDECDEGDEYDEDDECDEDDEHVVFGGLCRLVEDLPSVETILTTRPQPLADSLLSDHDSHNIFHLEDIEDKVVDDDIRLYLSHSFSQKQVREHLQNPKEKWCASDEDIESLVKAAGRLFTIASTAVLYVLNKTLGNPGVRMKKLLGEIDQDQTPFQVLDRFYSVIVCSTVQVDDDDVGDRVKRYQSIVGTIAVIQTPLSVKALAYLVGEEVENIYAMLRNLQSVILLGSDDVPRVYHKSFFDYLTDPTRCEDGRLRIDPGIHHTPIARRCFEVMDKYLKYNILGLGVPARYMSNEDGLKEEGIELEKKIPQELYYACVYWINHLVANVEDIDLTNAFEEFVNKHMLHWIEFLSLIGKLDLAHRIIRDAIKLMKSTSSESLQLLSDALRFIFRFYAIIERSALHTYYSALPFTPTQSILYRRYIDEAVDNVFVIDDADGPQKWDDFSHEHHGNIIKFSLDSSLFVSWSGEYVSIHNSQRGKLKIWDASTGTPISIIPGGRFAIANDFSTVASSEGSIISCYSVNGSARGTMFTTSSAVLQLALSSESNRVAAALDDKTVLLWDSKNSKLIDRESPFFPSDLQFSATGTRLAYLSLFNNIKLRDGISGRFVADLQCGPQPKFKFSGDGFRIVSLSSYGHLKLWNSESGALIDDVKDVRCHYFAISTNGSLLATANRDKVKLWSENDGHLAQIEVLECNWHGPIMFSVNDILAFTTRSHVQLYDVKTRSFISTLPLDVLCSSLAFSPDCTRLALADCFSRMYLWDIRGMDASSPLLKEKSKALTAWALSRDCSRLACGFWDGTIELWRTDPMTGTKQRISLLHSNTEACFGESIFREGMTLMISPDGKLLASRSVDETIKLWNTKDGSLRGSLKVPGLSRHFALSNSVLFGVHAATAEQNYCYTLWNLDTLCPIHTFEDLELQSTASSVPIVSIAENSALIAIAVFNRYYDYDRVSLIDVMKKTIIATFNVPRTRIMTFLPNNSHLVVQSYEGIVRSLNLIDKHTIEGPTLEHLIQLPDTTFWHGILIRHCMDEWQHYFSALFPQHKKPVPVLWIPKQIHVTEWTQGSSMIALKCSDGRVIFLRLHTSHVS